MPRKITHYGLDLDTGRIHRFDSWSALYDWKHLAPRRFVIAATSPEVRRAVRRGEFVEGGK